MAQPLQALLSVQAWDALQLQLEALQDQGRDLDPVAMDYMAKLLCYLAFICDHWEAWATLPDLSAPVAFMVAAGRKGLCVGELLSCAAASIGDFGDEDLSRRQERVPEEHLVFSQGQVRQLEDNPKALPWAFLEKMTLYVLDRITSRNLSPRFGEQATQLVQAVAGVMADAGTTQGAAPALGVAQMAAQGRRAETFVNRVSALGKLSTAGVAAASGAQVFGGAAIMTGAAQAGSTAVGGAIATVAGVSAAPAGVAATAVAPAILAYTAMSAVLPNDAAGNVGRVAGAAGGTAAVVGTAAGLGTLMSAGVTAASGATVYGGAALASTLTGVGSLVGGGMAAGTVVLATVPALAVAAVGGAGYGLYRLFTKKNRDAPASEPSCDGKLGELLQPFSPALPDKMVEDLIRAGITTHRLPHMTTAEVDRLFTGNDWVLARLLLISVISYLSVKTTL